MKDKRTNKKYNPTKEFNKAINSNWFKKIVTRMGKEVDIRKTLWQSKKIFDNLGNEFF